MNAEDFLRQHEALSLGICPACAGHGCGCCTFCTNHEIKGKYGTYMPPGLGSNCSYNPCEYCGGTGKAIVEHVMPVE